MLGVLVYGLALVPAVPPEGSRSAESPRPAEVELAWQAPVGCPDAQTMRDRIAELTVDPAGEGTLVVDGRVEEGPKGFRLTLRTSYGNLSETRTVVDEDCDALGGTAALFVAVSLEPASAGADAPSEPEVVPAEPEPDAAVEVAQSRPAVAPVRDDLVVGPRPRRLPPVGFVGVAPQVEFGSLPGVTGGPRLSVGVQWPRAEVALYGYYGAPRRTAAVQGASGLTQMGAAGGRGCVVFGSTVQAPLCALAEVGALSVASRDLDPANDLRYVWSAVGARGGVGRRWGSVGVFGAAEAAVPTSRARVLLGGETAFSTWPVSVRAIVGVQIFFATDSA
ncbi:MAG: hypothetical protein ACE37F_29885 [Nannocystaceae bacterium]|nr:hypothetical protein [bacterium]